MNVPVPLRQAVIQRSNGRCEYCGLAQTGQEARFHVDHIQPLAAGGVTEFGNLALACVSCSLRKGACLTVPDPLTGQPAEIFHPRNQVWSDHFQWKGCRVIGRTPSGRVTVERLKMNRMLVQAIRGEESLRGRHPPPDPGK